MTEEIEELIHQMNELRMTSMITKLEMMAEEPDFEYRKTSEVMKELFGYECALRKARKINRLLKRAHLKYPAASLDDSLGEADRRIDIHRIESLAQCTWIDDKRNLLVTGKSGTGKTYVSCALAICALQKGKEVLYNKASRMIEELNECQFTGNYAAALKRYTEVDLLVIDDFGLMSLDLNKCLQLFEVLDAREGNGSILVISQIPVKQWYETFQNNVYADACMSRLVSNSYRLEFNGKDMRKAVSEKLK